MHSIMKAVCVAAATLTMCSQAYAGSLGNAQRLVSALGVETELAYTIETSIAEAKQQLHASGELPIAIVDNIANALRDEMLFSMPELLDEFAQLYADRFTDPELLDLIEFYESPTGQKLVASNAELTQEAMEATEAWIERVSERAVTRLLSS